MFQNDKGRRVVVIVGAGKGFGKSVAEEFAKADYCVLLNSLDDKELKIAADDISNSINDKDGVAILQGMLRNWILVNR